MADAPTTDVAPLVVKVGGSLIKSGRFATVLEILAVTRVPTVLVPGGGPFADSVRALQPALQFDDEIAHRLAMLAMQQTGELMVATHPRFQIGETPAEIIDCLSRGMIPVWAPAKMLTDDKTLPAGWSATSDSLAAWLAERLGARELLLVKSVDVAAGASLEDLARDGIVDPVMPGIVARAGLSWSIFGPAADVRLGRVLQGEGRH
ncbi:uridylate kinase [Hyphomicrobium methylovorum]|uniref:amino acid kinase family protein n=1 Tax=Hyphomicrobium methylovorum TaxID=84 RepID=UPI0015E767D5|nr:uridylate kinase [Hyphomicrobium methylovorum]